MPGMDGLEMLSRIRASGSTVRVVVMTGHGDVATAVRAMRLGAWDFLEKPFAPPLMLQAIRSAVQAGPTSEDIEVLARAFAEQVKHLSPRERDVCERVLNGKTNKEIALELDISPRTVETYRAKLMVKTGCIRVQDLVRLAVRIGLI
jgi:two-component system response regulator FixJ